MANIKGHAMNTLSYFILMLMGFFTMVLSVMGYEINIPPAKTGWKWVGIISLTGICVALWFFCNEMVGDV